MFFYFSSMKQTQKSEILLKIDVYIIYFFKNESYFKEKLKNGKKIIKENTLKRNLKIL